MSLLEFGNDPGTLWLDPGSEPIPLPSIQGERGWKRRLRKLLKERPIVWFVDDERGNRECFVDYHRRHFGVLTFSSGNHCIAALRSGTPCDVVVTDIFFPAQEPKTDSEAQRLRDIGEQIRNSRVHELPALWKQVQRDWHLDGFEIAKDTTEIARSRKERIPVFLFSRKATLLLNRDEWLNEPSLAVENTFWLLEKLDPSDQGASAHRAAGIQRDRILAGLRWRQAAAPWWLKLLGRMGLRFGPFSFSLGRRE